jgi:hypothetical protein
VPHVKKRNPVRSFISIVLNPMVDNTPVRFVKEGITTIRGMNLIGNTGYNRSKKERLV